MALSQCIDNYCSINKLKIDIDCRDLDFPPGSKIVIDQRPMPLCWCICSCLARDTPLASPDGWTRVQDVVAGHTVVLAAGLDLTWSPVVVRQWSVAPPGKPAHVIYLHFQAGGEDQELVVTRDQLFLIHGGGMQAAGKLSPHDGLVDRDGRRVPLLDIGWGVYDGEFYEIATTMEVPNANLDRHLILSAGVVTADLAVQAFQEVPGTPAEAVLAASRSHPSVGTPEWLAQCRGGLAVSREPGALLSTGRFTQADPDRVRIPAYASDFLPPAQARSLEIGAPKKPFHDPLNRRMADGLLERFRRLYPGVEFHFDWSGHEVNAHSWIDARTGTRNVSLSGGMARIAGFDSEGVALVVGHELGHLYGQDIGPARAACEDAADYFGSAIALRGLWPGERYTRGMSAAIGQFDALTSYLKRHSAGARQAHPSLRHRRETFRAALASNQIPPCGPDVNE